MECSKARLRLTWLVLQPPSDGIYCMFFSNSSFDWSMFNINGLNIPNRVLTTTLLNHKATGIIK